MISVMIIVGRFSSPSMDDFRHHRWTILVIIVVGRFSSPSMDDFRHRRRMISVIVVGWFPS
jgi:hypothetical protein